MSRAPRARGEHKGNGGPGTTPERVRPGERKHGLQLRVQPLRCGVCSRPSDRPVCRKCEPLVQP